MADAVARLRRAIERGSQADPPSSIPSGV